MRQTIPQVHYRTGSVAPIIPVYGELDVEDDVVPQEISKTPTPPPPPPKQQHTLPPSGSNEGKYKIFIFSPLDGLGVILFFQM